MASDDDFRDRSLIAVAAIAIGSLILIAGAMYMVKNISLSYGVGLGVAAQSIASNTPVAAVLQGTQFSLTALHDGILESYVLFLVSLGLGAAALLMFIKRYEEDSTTIKKYQFLHLAFTVVYLLLFFIIISDFYSLFQAVYIYIYYFGVALCLVAGGYLELLVRQQSAAMGRIKQSLTINPNKPFSNIVALQEQLFPNMSGHLKIIDKHFNSSALVNLSRGIDRNITNFTKITILTSKEMLDSGFSSNLTDFKNELSEDSIGLEVKLMDEKDAVEQHERLLLDDNIAYKIPPFNIINKRSEHITTVNFKEAQKRFQHLYNRAIKIENFAVKRARDGEQPENPPKG